MNNYFKDKKIMIIVPHEDDELNLVGGLLVSKYFDPKKVFIVFTTNGDFLCNYKVRIRESSRVAKKLHIPLNNLIFLGYADQHIKEEKHMYLTHKPDVFTSIKGDSETFGTKKVKDFHYKLYNRHSEFNYESLLQDCIDVIGNYKPDVLYAIDFDSHPDHRAASLIFDKAMGRVLKENKEYRPLIYKGFAYPTAYKGERDFADINFKSTVFKEEPFSLTEMQNPYYKWEERVRFPVNIKNNLFRNPFYKLLKIYRSQLIIKRSYSIINNDVVFWQRPTNNLCLDAYLEASSGNIEFINDFMLFDVNNLMNGDCKIPIISDSAWIPNKDDEKKEIKVIFKDKSKIDKIVLYQNLTRNSKINLINIEFSNGKTIVETLEDYKTVISVNCDNKIEWIRINILKSEGEKAGFTELEILSHKDPLFKYFNVEIDNSFSSKKIYAKSLKHIDKINFYYYDGIESKYLKEDKILLNKKQFNRKNIIYGINSFSLRNSDNESKIMIAKYTWFNKFFHNIKIIMNNYLLKINIFIFRVINKINRLLKRL